MSVAEFQLVVKKYLNDGGSSREMADEFEAMVSTVDRWASGASVPHRRIQALVIAWVKARKWS